VPLAAELDADGAAKAGVLAQGVHHELPLPAAQVDERPVLEEPLQIGQLGDVADHLEEVRGALRRHGPEHRGPDIVTGLREAARVVLRD